jgi:ubiquinone/menaquinone biosynthesis C-methylase UbiE
MSNAHTSDPSWADEVKQRTRGQWSHNPAGDLGAGDEPLGTRESFARVEAYRYREQPWMRDTFHFERYRGLDVLEIGVGLGTDHVQFARAGARMTGIDLTSRCTELTGQRFDLEGLHSNLLTMDAEKLDFSDDAFDAVYSFGVLHHTPFPGRAFAEIRRVLRPRGVFLGGLYNKHSAFYAQIRLQRLVGSVRRCELPAESIEDRLSRVEHSTSDSKPLVQLLTAHELRRLLTQAGFADVELTRRHLGLHRYTRSFAAFDRFAGPLAGWYLIHHAR